MEYLEGGKLAEVGGGAGDTGTVHCAIGECPTLRRQLKDGQALVDMRGRTDELRAALTQQCERQNGLGC